LLITVVTGCAGVGDNTPDALTIANLQGTYDLNMNAVAANPQNDGGFAMISEVLEIDGNTTVFSPTFAGARPYTLSGDTLTLTGSDGYADVIQATFGNGGSRLTLVDNIEGVAETFVFNRKAGEATSNEVTETNLRGRYALDVAGSVLKVFAAATSGELEIARGMVKVSLTFSQTRPFTLSEGAVNLKESDGNTLVLQATLSENGQSLKLIFPGDGGSFSYVKR